MTDEQTPAQSESNQSESADDDRQRHEGRAFEPTRDRPDPNRIEPRQPDADDAGEQDDQPDQ